MLAMKMGQPDTFMDMNILSRFATGASNPALLTVSEGAPSATTLVGGTTPQATFDGVYMPIANLTTLNVNVGVGIQADIAAMFNYTLNAWSFDLGYNFYGRSCEKISKRDASAQQCCPNLCADYNV